MKPTLRLLLPLATSLLVATQGPTHAATTPEASPTAVASETAEQRDARMGWWRDAKFGMFIHWGVYSVPAGFYQDKPVAGIGEWIMNHGKIPRTEYQAFAKQFNPVKFDATQWVQMAKAAGIKYIVITAKHHDGFAMFTTKASSWNIMEASPFGRDPLKELAAACEKEGIKLGFYYSQAQDWNNDGAGNNWDPAVPHDMDKYIDKVAVPQVRELLTNYGPNVPATLWWDTPREMTAERAGKINAVVKELRPQMITNNRLGGGFPGDTETPEQFIPAKGYPGRDWESCMTINNTWGFKRDDFAFKSTETLLHNLIDIVSKGGNYLLNVGPTSEGVIPQPEVERLSAMGSWLKANGEAIYGTTASPFSRLTWGRATKRVTATGSTLYLHVFDWPKNGKLTVPGLQGTPKSASLLVSGEAVKTASAGGDLTIGVPTAAPDPIATVIKLEFADALNIEKRLPVQQPDGTVTLDAVNADVNNVLGSNGIVTPVEGIPTVTGWSNERVTVSWIFELKKPGNYTVSADYSAKEEAKADLKLNDKSAGAATFAVSTGDKKASDVGTVKIGQTGEIVLKLTPQKGWKAVELRSVTLHPIAE